MQGIVDVTVLNLNVCECMHVCILTYHVLLISVVKDDRTLPSFCQHNTVLVQDLTVCPSVYLQWWFRLDTFWNWEHCIGSVEVFNPGIHALVMKGILYNSALNLPSTALVMMYWVYALVIL